MPSLLHWNNKKVRPALPPPVAERSGAVVRAPSGSKAVATPAEKDVKRPLDGMDAPASFAEAQAMLWQGLNDRDARRVTLAASGLSAPERRKLFALPEPRSAVPEQAGEEAAPASEGLRPELPFCVANAVGDEASVRALLDQDADPFTGDAVPASALGLTVGFGNAEALHSLTGLFWAAHYGQINCLNVLGDENGFALDDVLLACEIEAKPAVVDWLRERGVTGEQLKRAALRATNENNPEAVRTLIRNGRVPLGASFSYVPKSLGWRPWEEATSAKGCSWLHYAVANDKLAVAHQLIDCGALTDKNAKARMAQYNEEPLSEVIERLTEEGQFQLYLPLVKKMLGCGLPVIHGHLKKALYVGGINGETLFMVLVQLGRAGSSDEAEASELLHLAQSQKMGRAVAILNNLITMLRYDGTVWSESERKENKHVVIANARKRILRVFEDEPYEDLPQGALLASNAQGPVSKMRGKNKTPFASLMARDRGGPPAGALDASETGALMVRGRKKKFS